MNIRPLHDWAVIRPSDAQEMTMSGLYIPESAKDKPSEGVVLEIGPGALEEEKRGKKKEEGKECAFIPTTIQPGTLVLYERYAGRTYTINGEELVLVRERDILGILPERAARSSVKPIPLQIPAATAPSSQTMLAKRAVSFPPMKTPKPVGKKASAASTVKPNTKKKAAKKAAAKTTTKKASAKKVQKAKTKAQNKVARTSLSAAKKTAAKKKAKKK